MLNRDASVFKNSLVTIDIADVGGITDGIHISWIIDSHGLSLLVLELSEISSVDKVAIFAFFDGDGYSLASTVVNQ